MRSERWNTPKEISKYLKTDVAGPILSYDNGKILSHNGEGHVMILGASGSGKSRRGTIPMAMSFIRNRESAVIVDPKGEIFVNTKNMIPSDYDVHVIDFRNLYESNCEGWNPLFAPYKLWSSKTAQNMYIGEQMIEEIAHAMYPEAKGTDPFWVKEARNVFLGIVYSLFEVADENEINLASVYYFMAKGEEKVEGSTYLKSFLDMSENNENALMQLQSYVTTANDTRGGIRSVFLDGLSIATRSVSVRNFLSHDELHINDLGGDKPTLIYIIVPDETPIYDDLTGVLVSQLMNHYVRIAEQKYAGKLPIRVNVLLEELGNIGRAVTNLPHLMTAGRSRNIRVQFVLQSISQLVDIYGESKATTIMDNCDVKIAFRVNHWDTLTELSRLCGEREVNSDGHIVREPLITQSQLSAMETGQALIMVSGRIKFITWLPDFTDMYISRQPVIREKRKEIKEVRVKSSSYFDIQKYVKLKKKEMLSNCYLGDKESDVEFPFYMGNNFGKKSNNIDDIISRIDKKIAELEAEEEMEKNLKINKCSISFLAKGDESKIADIISCYCEIKNLKKVLSESKEGVCIVVANIDITEADMVIKELQKVGVEASINNMDDDIF